MMEENQYDVVIMGGGMAASILAISLKRKNPDAKMAIIEQNVEHPRKVGESTSDVTSIFLRRFGIDHVMQRQVKKTGLRFIFNTKDGVPMDQCSDYSSPSVLSVSNGFQVNRSTWDDDLNKEAARVGVKLHRPAQVLSWDYKPFDSSVTFKEGETTSTYKTRWLIDASGRRGLVATQMGWRKFHPEHPTASCWAHFSNLKTFTELDGDKSEWWNKACIGDRQNATSHIMGKGYWWWHIPLHDGTTSLGIVYDTRIIKLDGQNPREWFFNFIKTDSRLAAMYDGATWVNYRHLPYLPFYSEVYSKPGLALIGDAACFIDPLFSPGMELTTHQILQLTPLISEEMQTRKYSQRKWSKYERVISRMFRTRFYLYIDRYYLHGDFRLFGLLTQLDFAGYYFFKIIPAAVFPDWLRIPLAFNWLSDLMYHICKRRLLHWAKIREENGIADLENSGGKQYSHAMIPQGSRKLWHGIFMFGLFFKRYFQMEGEMAALKFRLWRNREPKQMIAQSN
ncbi:MAG: NAD(P)/FAD-dependent oxidoreductase [Bdellovibrionia bacterium]